MPRVCSSRMQPAPAQRTTSPSAMCTIPAAPVGEVGVVGDQHQRGAALLAQGEHQVHDRLAGGAVEVAGRLVGQQQAGCRGEGAGQGDPLLLAAGELAGQVGQPVTQPDRAQIGLGAVGGIGAPASSSGTATFSSAVMVGIRWNAWNTMPMRRGRIRASASSDIAVMLLPGDATLPELARSSPASTISRLVLPEPEGPTTPTASPLVDVEVDAAQDVDRPGGGRHGQMQVATRTSGPAVRAAGGGAKGRWHPWRQHMAPGGGAGSGRRWLLVFARF